MKWMQIFVRGLLIGTAVAGCALQSLDSTEETGAASRNGGSEGLPQASNPVSGWQAKPLDQRRPLPLPGPSATVASGVAVPTVDMTAVGSGEGAGCVPPCDPDPQPWRGRTISAGKAGKGTSGE